MPARCSLKIDSSYLIVDVVNYFLSVFFWPLVQLTKYRKSRLTPAVIRLLLAGPLYLLRTYRRPLFFALLLLLLLSWTAFFIDKIYWAESGEPFSSLEYDWPRMTQFFIAHKKCPFNWLSPYNTIKTYRIWSNIYYFSKNPRKHHLNFRSKICFFCCYIYLFIVAFSRHFPAGRDAVC